MTPGLPYGRGGYRGTDSYQDQQESYDIRRELQPKDSGWVVRASTSSLWSVAGNLDGHATGVLYLVRLPIFHNTFELSEARIRVSTGAANENLKVGIYAYSTIPEKSLRLLTPSKVIFSVAAAGLITKTLPNKPRLIAGNAYFIGTIINDATVGVFSATMTNSGDEATVSITATDLPKNIPLKATTKSYQEFLPMPSYFSNSATEVV